MNAVVRSVAAAAAMVPRGCRAAWLALVLLTVAVAAVVGVDGPVRQPLVLAALGLFFVARGALWRLALGAGRPGPGGVQFGGVELRMLAAWTLATGFLLIIGGVLLVALLVVAYAVVSTNSGFDPGRIDTWIAVADGRARIVLGGAMTAAILTFAYAAARIGLGEAASVDSDGTAVGRSARAPSGRIVMLSTWPMTRPRWPAMVAAGVLVTVPTALVAVLGAVLDRSSQTAMQAGAIAAVWLWLPMNVGALAWFYRDAQRGASA